MNYIRLNKVPKPWGKVAGGGWHHVIQDEKPVAKMYCPECGKEGYLSDEGEVSPSVRCHSCSFHGWIALNGWELNIIQANIE
jgi:hypothetical protein